MPNFPVLPHTYTPENSITLSFAWLFPYICLQQKLEPVQQKGGAGVALCLGVICGESGEQL